MSSSRFSGKVLRKIQNLSLVESIGIRLSRAKRLDQIVFAISDEPSDDLLALELGRLGLGVFRGSLLDVQKRFIDCGTFYAADVLVRVTADCPLVDWGVVDSVVNEFYESGAEYTSNVAPATFPDGLDVEVFSLSTLVASRHRYESNLGKEHVTYDIRESGAFSTHNVRHDSDLSDLRWTVDYEDDLKQLEANLPPGFEEMPWEALLECGFTGVISLRERNEGTNVGSGQKLWARAKEVIPGGGMLLSKRSEMYLPNQWPSYYSKAKGIEVTDLDGRKFLDFSLMSVGTCSLGYGVDSVDNAVKEAVTDGVMSSLNSPAEVQLAERLIDLHPWADMARFARSGGEANAIAIRIARARTGKDKVAICGYHGWHDWYLSANLASDSNLDGHLLPGLEPSGVPRALAGTTVPFEYNDIEGLRRLLVTGEFAAVKMEVSRNFGPAKGFLESVREMCTQFGAILIFDECTSGFRETFGGLHLKYGVEPDLAMFGKALGNGFAITSVIGRGDVMQAAQSTFISSTFWTERLGPVAALATLAEMEKQRSWTVISQNGANIKAHWKKTLTGLGLPVQVGGLDSLATFSLDLPNWNAIKTFFTQEMLRRGLMATSAFYSSTAHTEELMAEYFNVFDEVFEEAALLVTEGKIESRLLGPAAHQGFRRLN
jgi:glutamate-1-semialdehyde 2,1-aminomutase